MGLVSLLRETGDVGIILTKGKRLILPPCQSSSINQVPQGQLNPVSGVDKKWGADGMWVNTQLSFG